MKGLLIHVGLDTGYKLVAPIFQDSRFEYVPIPEDVKTFEKTFYSNIPSRVKEYGNDLSVYVHRDFVNSNVHHDPEFLTFTYGEPYPKCPINRGYALKRLVEGDIIFFVSSLSKYESGASFVKFQRGKKNKYVIGYFSVISVADVERKDDDLTINNIVGTTSEESIMNNAHYKRSVPNRSVIVRGEPSSCCLLEYAVPLTSRFESNSFILTELGKALLGREKDNFRGFRWLDECKTKMLLKKLLGNDFK